jgi:hypothetical protein
MTQRVDDATAAELERLELLLMDPAIRRDRERVAALLAENFFEFGSSRRVWTRETTLDLLSEETYTPPEVEDFASSTLGPDAVLVTYRTVRNGENGQRVATLRSSIWVKVTGEAGKWKIRFHQGTPARKRAVASNESRSVNFSRYNSRRWKISSFSRLGQLVHSRQQTRSTATPRVIRMAKRLAYEAIQ